MSFTMTNFVILFLLLRLLLLDTITSQEETLPEYVVSECYGDIFSFDCGPGHKIRINKDFFGYSHDDQCHYHRGDCITSNPKSNSLIHRYCTGRGECTYYLVERRACDGYYSNYQQVEYQCVSDSMITNVCSNIEYETSSTYIATPNFPGIYPPNLDCNCVVTSAGSDERVRMEIVYMAVKFHSPCRDWLKIGRRKICGTRIDLFSGRRIPIQFHSDEADSHSGFWLHFQSSTPGSKIRVRCGNKIVRRFPSIRNTTSQSPQPTSSVQANSPTTVTPTRSISLPAHVSSSSPQPTDNSVLAPRTNRTLFSPLPSPSTTVSSTSPKSPEPEVRDETFVTPTSESRENPASFELPIPTEWFRTVGRTPNKVSEVHDSGTAIVGEKFEKTPQIDESDIVHILGEMMVSKTGKGPPIANAAQPDINPTVHTVDRNYTRLHEISESVASTADEKPSKAGVAPGRSPPSNLKDSSEIVNSKIAEELHQWWDSFNKEDTALPSTPRPVTGEETNDYETDYGDDSREGAPMPWIEGVVESTIEDIYRSATEAANSAYDEPDGLVPSSYDAKEFPLDDFSERFSLRDEELVDMHEEDVVSAISDRGHQSVNIKEILEDIYFDGDHGSRGRSESGEISPSVDQDMTLNDASSRQKVTFESSADKPTKSQPKIRVHGQSIETINDDNAETTGNTTDSREVQVFDNPILPKDSLLSLGLIILYISIVVGLIFLIFALVAFSLKRRYTGLCGEEIGEVGVSRSSVASGESDQGSGTGLLLRGPKRKRSCPRALKAHAAACSVATIAVQSETRVRKVDKCVQINADSECCPEESLELSDTYLVPARVWSAWAESAVPCSAMGTLHNCKAVQANLPRHRADSRSRSQLKRRKVFKKVCRDGTPSSDVQIPEEQDQRTISEPSSSDAQTRKPRPQVPPKPTAPKPKRDVWSAPVLPIQRKPDSPEFLKSRGSIASLSELAEVTISPQSLAKCSPTVAPSKGVTQESPDDVIFVLDNSGSDDTDWETKSAISL